MALSLAPVTWIHPYGAVCLLGVCRYFSQLTQNPVRLTDLKHNIHAYLRRIDFFERSLETAYTLESCDPAAALSRSSFSSTVLELVPIQVHEDVYKAVTRGRHILANWLGNASYDIDRIVSLLAEACSNVVDHSCDIGVLMIQKYERGRSVDVELAISDLGQGIRRSLLVKHGEVSDTFAGYIERALAGLSARPGERGGQGLGAIQRIATESGGTLHIRSEMGSLLAKQTGTVARNDLAFFPGTQIAITFRSTPAQ